VVTAGVSQGAAAQLIRNGISGIFMKNQSADLLAQGIHDVMAGKVWFDRDLLQGAMSSDDGPRAEVSKEDLTERQRHVLRLVFEGLANKEIAQRIGVSESSVKATLQQLFSKMAVHTRSNWFALFWNSIPTSFEFSRPRIPALTGSAEYLSTRRIAWTRPPIAIIAISSLSAGSSAAKRMNALSARSICPLL